MRVYYMTTTEWATAILRDRRLKFSRFHESNDPFELKLIDGSAKETRWVLDIIENHYTKKVGMICFGASWSSPVMWAHYAAKHAGVCLGFDIDDSVLTKIDYTDAKIAVPFGGHLPDFGLSSALLTKVVSTKATDWSYEREYRVMAPLVTQDPRTGLYFNDLGTQIHLREVIIGYRCKWTAESTRELIGKVATPVRICKAKPSAGKFEMIEDSQS